MPQLPRRTRRRRPPHALRPHAASPLCLAASHRPTPLQRRPAHAFSLSHHPLDLTSNPSSTGASIPPNSPHSVSSPNTFAHISTSTASTGTHRSSQPDSSAPIPDLDDARHAMGGATMGIDPRSSVVDRDLRVHGLRNLFIASAAVFPDGSPQLPTLPLMALTLRLAQQLQQLTR